MDRPRAMDRLEFEAGQSSWVAGRAPLRQNLDLSVRLAQTGIQQSGCPCYNPGAWYPGAKRALTESLVGLEAVDKMRLHAIIFSSL